MGGVLAADKVHKKCMQKTLCTEFSDEIVEMTEEVGAGAAASLC